MAQDLHNLIDHYQLDQLVVVGHSMGALTLWQYIEEHGCESTAARSVSSTSRPKLLTDAEWLNGIYGDFDRRAFPAAFLNHLESDFAESVLLLGAMGLNDRAREKYHAGIEGPRQARQWLKEQDPAPLIACWESLTEADYRATLDRDRYSRPAGLWRQRATTTAATPRTTSRTESPTRCYTFTKAPTTRHTSGNVSASSATCASSSIRLEPSGKALAKLGELRADDELAVSPGRGCGENIADGKASAAKNRHALEATR
jgi:pimeloyl-ACP methyl ester carboxylesterase